WDTRSWRVIRELTADTRSARSVAFSPDASLLATGGGEGTITLWDASAWRPRSVLSGHDGQVNCVRFSPDGRTLASTGLDGTVRLWEVDSPRMHRVLRLGKPGVRSPVRGLALSHDGRLLACLSPQSSPE